MKIELWLAARFIFRNRRRYVSFISTVACLGVALGVCSLIVVLAVMNGFSQHLRQKLLGFNFHVVAYLNNPEGVDTTIIEQLDGVDSVVLFSQVQTALRKDKQLIPVVFQGLRFNSKEAALWRKYSIAGDYTKLVAGNLLAQSMGLSPKDTVEIFNPKDFKPVKFEVSGIFSFGIYDLDSNFVIYPLDEAKDFLEKTKSTYALGIRIDDVDKAAKVKREILSQNLADISFVRTWAELNETLFSALKLEKATMFLILSLIVLVASFNIFALLVVKVAEKTKDIGILKSIGMSKTSINVLFCAQGIILGLLGTFFGSVFGIGLCYLLKKYQFISLPAQIYYIEYLPVQINYRDVLVIGIVAFFMSVVFSLGPSIRASRVKEIDALRYE